MLGLAQDCIFKLQEAEKLYTQGLIEEIPELLDSCIQKGFSKDEKLQALKLIILAHLFDDNLEEADNKMYNFLRLYPEYEITPADPAEFVQLFESYNVLPRFSVGVHMGTSLSLIQVLEPFGTHNLYNSERKYSFTGVPLTVGVNLHRLLFDNFELNLEMNFSTCKFEYNNENYSGFGNINYNESQSRIDMPLSCTYDIGNKRIKPYLRLGIGGGYLIESSTKSILQYLDGSHDDRKGENIVRTDNRNVFTLWGIVGTGLKYKLPKGYILADVRYNQSLINQVKPEYRYKSNNSSYSENDFTWFYFLTDENFLMNNISFSVGYVRLLYKPRKK